MATADSFIPMLNLVRLHRSFQAALDEAVIHQLHSGQYILGGAVRDFEALLCQALSVDHAVGVSCGTDGLKVALSALGIGPGDEVICPAFSFFATCGAVLQVGATPVFADIDQESFNIDPAAIEPLITTRTRAIVPVHLFGQCAPMDPILAIARRHGLAVVEDSAQGFLASDEGRLAGTMGDLGVFSFFPAKNLGAAGDGGAVVTRDGALAKKVRALRVHGQTEPYVHQWAGGNHRLDALQAAILQVKLPRVARWNRQRRQVAAAYASALDGIGALAVPSPTKMPGHVFNQYVVRVKTGARDEVRARMARSQVATAIYYPVPLHRQPCVASPVSAPVAEKACQEVLALPMDPLLTDEEIGQVVAALCGALKAS